jgi:hypothetical protein
MVSDGLPHFRAASAESPFFRAYPTQSPPCSVEGAAYRRATGTQTSGKSARDLSLACWTAKAAMANAAGLAGRMLRTFKEVSCNHTRQLFSWASLPAYVL